MEDVGMWDDLGQESVEKGVVLVITWTEPNTSKHGRGGLSPQLGADKCKKKPTCKKKVISNHRWARSATVGGSSAKFAPMGGLLLKRFWKKSEGGS